METAEPAGGDHRPLSPRASQARAKRLASDSRRLEDEGVITGYTALVDQKAYGLPITVFVRVRLDRHGQDLIQGFEAQVARIDQILDCFLLAGSDDYLLRVIVDSLEAYEDFVRRKLHAIPGIASIDTSGSPLLTCCPGLTASVTTMPGIGAPRCFKLPSSACGRRADFAEPA